MNADCALYSTKLARHGRVLVVVDQPATIGALPVTVVQSGGVEVADLPRLAMRRLADLHPGKAKMPGARSSSPTRPARSADAAADRRGR
jgi:hypothetical protein